MCHVSNLISREDSSRGNRVRCYLSPIEGDDSHWGCHQQSLFVCAVANRKRGGQWLRGLTTFYHFLDTVLPTKRVTKWLAAATAVHQPHDKRPSENGARLTLAAQLRHTVDDTRSVTANWASLASSQQSSGSSSPPPQAATVPGVRAQAVIGGV